MSELNIREKLLKIQIELHAPKNNYNSFGGYHYRSLEDIVEAIKPLCEKYDALLTISDGIVEVGGRVYVKAIVSLENLDRSGVLTGEAYAREQEDKKGMDQAQITGAASSYARKYALNGLFCIDDVKDADTQRPEDNEPQKGNVKVYEEIKEKITDAKTEIDVDKAGDILKENAEQLTQKQINALVNEGKKRRIEIKKEG
jgi:hypothetical protein